LQRAEDADEHLLDEGASRLTQWVSDDIHGSLALDLGLGVERNVGHFLARVEQGVLGALGQDVLVGTDHHSHHQRCHSQSVKIEGVG